MSIRARRTVPLFAVMALGLAACGGGSASQGTSDASGGTAADTAATTIAAAPPKTGCGSLPLPTVKDPDGVVAALPRRAPVRIRGLPLHGPQESVGRLEADGPRRTRSASRGGRPRPASRTTWARPSSTASRPARWSATWSSAPWAPTSTSRSAVELQRAGQPGRRHHDRRAAARAAVLRADQEGRREGDPDRHRPDGGRHALGGQRLAQPHPLQRRDQRPAAADDRRQGQRPAVGGIPGVPSEIEADTAQKLVLEGVPRHQGRRPGLRQLRLPNAKSETLKFSRPTPRRSMASCSPGR